MLKVAIHIKGQIDPRWAEWFSDLTIIHCSYDETLLSGLLHDHTALYGVICRLRDLGMEMKAVESEEVSI